MSTPTKPTNNKAAESEFGSLADFFATTPTTAPANSDEGGVVFVPPTEDMLAIERAMEETAKKVKPAPTEPAPAPEPSAETPPAETPAKTPDPEVLQLQAQVAAMKELIAAQRQTPQPPAETKKVQTPQEVLHELSQKYAYNWNDPQLIAKLRSDDSAEFAQGLGAVLAATAASVHMAMREELEAKMAAALQAQQQAVVEMTQVQQEGKRIEQDFYAKNPHLADPTFRPIIAQVAQHLWQEKGQTQWTPEFRDAVAQRVTAILSQALKTAAPAAPAATQTARPQQPFVAGNPPARAPAAPTNPNSREAIADLLR